MYKPLSTLLFMISLLIAFVGQATADHFIAFGDDSSARLIVDNAYNQLAENQPQRPLNNKPKITEINSDKLNSNDASCAKALNDIDDCCDVECCENQCFCPANACASVVYLNNDLPFLRLILLSESALLFEQVPPTFIATSLYRPPIFTS